MGRKGARLSDVLLGSQKALQLHEDLAHRHGAGLPYNQSAPEHRRRSTTHRREEADSLATPVAVAIGRGGGRGRGRCRHCRVHRLLRHGWRRGLPTPAARRSAGCPPRCLRRRAHSPGPRGRAAGLRAGPRLLPAGRHLRKQPYVGVRRLIGGSE